MPTQARGDAAIRLIACDMDGTLLDSQKRLPRDFAAVFEALRARGTLFAVASGRQYAVLRRDMAPYAEEMLFICENGALVMHRGKRLLIDPLEAADLPAILDAVRGLRGVYPVVCRAEMAYIERSASQEFIQNTCMYYPSVQVVEDLSVCLGSPDVCKVAFYDEGDAQTHEWPALERALGERVAVILSGEHWVDVMKPGVSKGKAMRAHGQRRARERARVFEDQAVGVDGVIGGAERAHGGKERGERRARGKLCAPGVKRKRGYQQQPAADEGRAAAAIRAEVCAQPACAGTGGHAARRNDAQPGKLQDHVCPPHAQCVKVEGARGSRASRRPHRCRARCGAPPPVARGARLPWRSSRPRFAAARSR